VPIYELRCRTCETTFEVNRPMAQADDPAPCPQGHPDTVRAVTGLNVGGRAGSAARPHIRVRAGDAAPPQAPAG
jgi:putative FmdB family regulatory protein